MDYIPAGLALSAAGGLYYYWTKQPDHLKYIPGPPNPSLFFGNMKAIIKADNSVLHEEWVETYGPVISYAMPLGQKRLFTMDSAAINHILMNSFDYEKPSESRWALGRILGPGLLVVEGTKHKNQRKVMNPAFAPAQIRLLTDVFIEEAVQLREMWMSQLENTDVVQVDALSWLTKATLDIIGLAGFNYKFDTLKNSAKNENELDKAFNSLFKTPSMSITQIVQMLQAMFPILRPLPFRDGNEGARDTLRRVSEEILEHSKAALEQDSTNKAKDILSLLVKANTGEDVPLAQRLSEDEVIAQLGTFVLAGHETTSNATTWALFALSIDKAIQSKLRKELLDVQTEQPTMDELNALPYLDAVVREVFRLHAPVPSTIRVATKDDVLPLSQPFTDTRGQTHTSIPVNKGQTLFIPILAMNRNKAVWGDDAGEFKPERWEKQLPDAVKNMPGLLSMMTFLAGPRACIGYRFSLVEIKSLLFVLLRAFEFELAVPVEDIGKKASVVQRPILKSNPDGGNQLPILIRPHIQ